MFFRYQVSVIRHPLSVIRNPSPVTHHIGIFANNPSFYIKMILVPEFKNSPTDIYHKLIIIIQK